MIIMATLTTQPKGDTTMVKQTLRCVRYALIALATVGFGTKLQ